MTGKHFRFEMFSRSELHGLVQLEQRFRAGEVGGPEDGVADHDDDKEQPA